jgi:trans-aconitate 2-methyltransferase
LLIHHRNRWDAQTYDQVSRLVQYRWGQEVLEWRNWIGNETIMDAGCGSGLLTKLLAQKVPKGKIYGVDIDCNMIKQAKKNLKDLENVELVLSDFSDVKLPTKLDVIFSNASLHWIHNHAKVFRHFWNMLKSRGTNRKQLLIQCGGYGNLKRILLLMRQVMELNEFKEYFANFNQPWYFPKPYETTKLLRKIGYTNNKVHLHNAHVTMTNRKVYFRFVKTVIMKPFLECLPDDKLRKRYLDSFLYLVQKKNTNRSQSPWSLDYVRLNIIADKR